VTIAVITEFPVWWTDGMNASCEIHPAPTTAYLIFVTTSSRIGTAHSRAKKIADRVRCQHLFQRSSRAAIPDRCRRDRAFGKVRSKGNEENRRSHAPFLPFPVKMMTERR
jgi:hypothetical protein